MEFQKIQTISDDTRHAIKRATAWSLPNNPSERGMKPNEIRRAFYQSIWEGTESLIGLQNKTIGEVNEILSEIVKVLSAIGLLCGVTDAEGSQETLQTDAKTLISAINELDTLLRARFEDGSVETLRPYDVAGSILTEDGTVIGKINAILDWMKDLQLELNSYAKAKDLKDHIGASVTDEKESDPHQTREAIARAKSEILSKQSNIERKNQEQDRRLDDLRAVSEEHDERMKENTAEIKKNRTLISMMKSTVDGMSRRFSLPDFSALVRFMEGKSVIAAGNSLVYASDLVNGDSIILVERGVADFWFQKTADVSKAETYTYQGVAYRMIVRDESGSTVGLLHIEESYDEMLDETLRRAEQYADSAQSHSEKAERHEETLKALVNSIFYVQKAPTLEHINDAVILPSPTLAMLPDGTV